MSLALDTNLCAFATQRILSFRDARLHIYEDGHPLMIYQMVARKPYRRSGSHISDHGALEILLHTFDIYTFRQRSLSIRFVHHVFVALLSAVQIAFLNVSNLLLPLNLSLCVIKPHIAIRFIARNAGRIIL